VKTHPIIPTNEKLILDARDIEVLTGLGRTKVRALLRQQAIPSFRIGKCIRVSRVEFERWLERQHEIARREAERFHDAKSRMDRNSASQGRRSSTTPPEAA